jgi:RNA polymerase-binding transcription factor DksA
MRHHFYRCGFLRLVSLNASDQSGARKGGESVLDELCEARGLEPCVGIVDCPVLATPQKRHLIALRATRRLEDEELARLFDEGQGERARELGELREGLVEEREQIVEENRRTAAEQAAALDAYGTAGPSEEAELQSRGISVRLDEAMRAFRAARLDAIDGALAAMQRGGYGRCVHCGAAIDTARLRTRPDAQSCAACELQEHPATSHSGARA